MVRSEIDCEDAFQAVFLALFRRAQSIDPRQPLGGWLHGAAVRAAFKATANAARSRPLTAVCEQTTTGDIADELGNGELFRVVDEEIARLPALLREPFVLCCLEGRTRDEAAAALDCSVAAIKSRLERSREILRRRLERRGFGLPAAFLVLALTGIHVRASPRAKALQSVLECAPPGVASLLPAVGASLTNKLTLAAMSLIVVGALSFGALHVMQAEPPQEKSDPAKDAASKVPQNPLAEKPQLRVDRFGDPLPDGAIRRFGTLRFRHAGIIEDLAFTPDGKRLIAGMGMKPLAVFDALTGRKLRDVGKSTGSGVVGTFTVSPDGKWIASCGENVFLWEIETGRLVRELHCERCRSVAFSADGKVLAAAAWLGGKPEITLVELATGKHLRKWSFKEDEFLSFDLRPLAFSFDGKYMAGLFCKQRAGRTNVIDPVSAQVWLLDAKTGSRVRTFGSPGALIGAFAFQPRTGRLATIEKKGVLRFWDVETWKELHHFSIAREKRDNKDSYNPKNLRFSSDGHRCVVADGIAGFLIVIDAQTSREVRRTEIAKSATGIAADLSRDGRAIAAARTYGLPCVRVWDVDTGIERLGDAGHRTPPILALSADERTLIGRSEDGQVIHWDRRSGHAVEHRNELPGKDGSLVRPLGTVGDWTLRGPRSRLNFDFATSTLAAYSLGGERLLGKAKWPPSQDLIMSPDGVYVAAPLRDDRHATVLLWNPEKEKEPRRLCGDVGDRCWTLLFSHDSKRLIAASSSLLRVWDVETAKPIQKMVTKGIPGVLLLTPDDRVLISGGLFIKDGTVHVWDMKSG